MTAVLAYQRTAVTPPSPTWKIGLQLRLTDKFHSTAARRRSNPFEVMRYSAHRSVLSRRAPHGRSRSGAQVRKRGVARRSYSGLERDAGGSGDQEGALSRKLVKLHHPYAMLRTAPHSEGTACVEVIQSYNI